ncbi:class I SAM-dependent methyltransferase [Leeuwenhoekiella marinoflava]|uniref:Cyclopropane fatty-acyl-phospholipid synthase-like methyltransferase n=2 Tax=Leeuwenhoekiella marinoflava TaxID=988 RepID=A0A4Q0PIJ4_9FLAO|nr:class I SAM-dependent methyltransferase [Leeuwenhoekiella marinoflava]RXG26911.1 cyclopropane fatty-acyl-phospholipid synthase-like methyltransferase [Leeuwenhoekiella marinoflava]SHF40938.1 Cyclopropane fatty-acyl-phospholipid synthase [Leeuwenhoekiella marinoflava DSM 3653]
MKESLDYYNAEVEKMTLDYLKGNPRVESAIKEFGKFILPSSETLLDIGCGIGWSTYEFAKAFSNSKVLGIDLSPILIKKATALFENTNLEYKVIDITKNLSFNLSFDVISMIDVYEHIPLNLREKFHNSLKDIISPGGRIMLACPSKYHQKWLRENKPSGLQPVDEDVDFKTIQKLSVDLDCEVIFFSYKKIWRTYDYFYAVLERCPQYNSERKIIQDSPVVLESQAERYKRLDVPYSKKHREFKGYYMLKRLKNIFR